MRTVTLERNVAIIIVDSTFCVWQVGFFEKEKQ